MKMKEIYTTKISPFRIRTAKVLTRLLAITLLVVMAGFANQLLAQVSVTATAGTVGPTAYLTLKDAFDAINLGTHQGAITISLTGSTTETASAVLNSGAVLPAVYTSVGITATVPVTISGNILGAIIKLNGADNVTIDGRIAGAGRNITVSNSSNSTGSAVIWLASVIAGNGASNNIIRNLELACGVANTNAFSTFGIIMCGTTVSTTANGVDNDNNQFIFNRIIRARYGIVTRGTTTDNNIAPIVTDNIIGPTSFGPDEISKTGILMQADDGAIVSRNTIQFVGGDLANSTVGADRFGIAIGSEAWGVTASTTLTSRNYTVTKNIIHDIVEERTFSSVGIILATTQGGGATNNLVANNMLYNIRSNGTSGDQVCGIGIVGGNGDRIVNNSISLTGDMDPGASLASTTYGNAIRIPGANGTNNANFVVQNNSIYVDASSSSTAALRFYAITLNSAAYVFGTGGLNFNNYYINPANTQLQTGGLGTSTGNTATTQFATLANWQAALTTPQDAASIQMNPNHFSATGDLHLTLGSPNINVGTTIAAVTDDIDGETRPIDAIYDIGADEFNSANPCVVTPVTVMVAPSSANFCSGGTPVVLTASGANTYAWSPASGLSATTGNPVSASPGATTTYTVTGTRTADGCTGIASVTVTVLASPTISSATATPSTVACGGTSQLLAVVSPQSVAPSAYSFAGSSGLYSSISGTAVTLGSQDDGFTGNLPIGFTFNTQTVFAVSPNGWIQLGQATSSSAGFFTNALASNANFIAPLWDDNNMTGGTIEYLTTGSVGSQVLTVQWTNMHVGSAGSATNPTISVQILLYEATGQIQIIYGSTSAALVGTTASIGISGNMGDFLSVTPLSPANTSTVSSGSENTDISSAANFPSGTIYTFTPPSAAVVWTPATFLSATNILNPIASNVTTTTIYTVTATAANGCTASATATVTVSPVCATCPTAPLALNGSGAVCSGGGTDGFGAWQTNRAAAVSGAGGSGVVNTLEYSTTVPSSGSPATGAGNITGMIAPGCTSVLQVVTAYLRCDNGTPNDLTDDVWTAIGTFTLTVYPAVQTPTLITNGCSFTVTGACAGDLVTLSSPSTMGVITGNGTNSATFTTDAGQPVGAITYSVASGVAGSTCAPFIGASDTPACSLIPSNDLCANATPITCGSSTAGTTVGAGNDIALGQAPNCFGFSTAGGVWYQFVGDGDSMTVSLCSPGTNYDSRMAIHTGTCGALTCVASSDDDCGPSVLDPLITFNSTLGTTYYVLVYGYAGGTGNFTITLTCVTVCPALTAAPAQVTVFNSACTTGCVVQGGFFTPPSCPDGTYVEYAVGMGGWSATLPTYNQTGPAQSIRTRCTCEEDSEIFGPASEPVVTMPGVCTPPTPSITSSNAALCIGDSRTLTANIPGGTFSVSGTGMGNFNMGPNILTATAEGTLMVSYTVTDANGCQGTAMQTITVNGIPIAPIAVAETSGLVNNDGIICAGATATLTAAGGGSPYTWSTGATSQIINVMPVMMTVYTVTMTNFLGCTGTATTTITVNPPPTAFTVTGGGARCATDNIASVPVGLSGSQTGVNYQLQLNNANTGAPVAGTGNAIAFPLQLAVGPYTVVATNATTTCTAIMTGTVTISTFDCTPTVFDPCTCLNNATTLTNGQFGESIKINAPVGQTWTVTAVSGLYTQNSPNPPSTPTPITVGTVLTNMGTMYILNGRHIDALGYTISISNGAGTSLSISNSCSYPNPVITTNLDGPFCLNTDPILLTGDPGDANLATTGPTEVFMVNGVPATSFDPGAGVGSYVIKYTVFGGVAKAFGPNDPGCEQSVSRTVNVVATPTKVAAWY